MPWTTSSATIEIGGLTDDTVYDVQVRTVDSSGNPGSWDSENQVFTTAYYAGVVDTSNDSRMLSNLDSSLTTANTEDRFQFTLQNAADDFSFRLVTNDTATICLRDSNGQLISGIAP